MPSDSGLGLARLDMFFSRTSTDNDSLNMHGYRQKCILFMTPKDLWLNLLRVLVVMAYIAPACISGVGKEWWENQAVKEQFGGESSLVKKFSQKAVMAVKDRWHAINNFELIAPIIALQKAAHVIKTPSLKSLEAEVTVFHALNATEGELDETNWPDLTALETSIHLDASSIKKILSFTRHHALRPHVPRDRGAKYLHQKW